jgi:hypothetical protein
MAGRASGEDCQQCVDTKAFKAFTGRGRAGLVDVRRLEADLGRIHAAMDELARASKTVPGRSFYLSVHRRANTGQHSLRWRNAVDNRHLPWDRMPGLFALQLPALAAWYVTFQARIETVNREECAARLALRLGLRQVRKAV